MQQATIDRLRSAEEMAVHKVGQAGGGAGGRQYGKDTLNQEGTHDKAEHAIDKGERARAHDRDDTGSGQEDRGGAGQQDESDA